ncbi:hypothetical protein ACRTDR_20280 [Shewanella algae]|uniref:hypothetical protein n=1 Tax=Shewanella TaxID=22 RepID=UPI001C5602DE|nr:hypothetical protein [Shewanella algae]
MLGGIFKASSGKKYGNQIADHLGVHRGLFHSAVEEGGCPMHLIRLHFLRKQNMSLDDAANHIMEFLIPGLRVIEERFGPQALIEDALENLRGFAHRYYKEDGPSIQGEQIVSSVFSEGRYELSYELEMVQRIRGKDLISKEPYVNRSDDLDGLKAMALMKSMGGVDVTLRDLNTGEVIPYR